MEKEVKTQLSEITELDMHYVVKTIREELDDHRDAINHNTEEAETTNEFLHQIMAQMDKLAERMDSMALYLKKQDRSFTDDSIFDILPLTKREKEVFSAIYELLQTQPEVTYKEIARKQVIALSVVPSYIASLIQKGVPIIKHSRGRNVAISLKKKFCAVQAKENIVGVNAKLTAWF